MTATNLATTPAISKIAILRPGRIFHKAVFAFDRPGGAPITYAIGDAVSDKSSTAEYLEFTTCARVQGGSGRILGAAIVTDEDDTATAFDLLIFSAAPTAQQDNDAMILDQDDLEALVAVIPMPAATNVKINFDGGSYYHHQAATDGTSGFVPTRSFRCADGSTSLYGLVRAGSAWVPTAGTILTITIDMELD